MDKKTEYLLLEVAPALTLEEAAEYCGIDLDDLNPVDLQWFKRAYFKGKHELKVQAVEALRNDMKMAKDKTKPALSVLLRFADEWNILDGDDGSGVNGANININVTGK